MGKTGPQREMGYRFGLSSGGFARSRPSSSTIQRGIGLSEPVMTGPSAGVQRVAILSARTPAPSRNSTPARSKPSRPVWSSAARAACSRNLPVSRRSRSPRRIRVQTGPSRTVLTVRAYASIASQSVRGVWTTPSEIRWINHRPQIRLGQDRTVRNRRDRTQASVRNQRQYNSQVRQPRRPIPISSGQRRPWTCTNDPPWPPPYPLRLGLSAVATGIWPSWPAGCGPGGSGRRPAPWRPAAARAGAGPRNRRPWTGCAR